MVFLGLIECGFGGDYLSPSLFDIGGKGTRGDLLQVGLGVRDCGASFVALREDVAVFKHRQHLSRRYRITFPRT